MDKPLGKVYLSGPIMGLTYDEARFGWRKYVAERLLPGIEPLSPMRQEGHLAEVKGPLGNHTPSGHHQGSNHIFSHAKMIVAKDRLDVQQASIVLVNFLGATSVSKGTLVELGWADAQGKTIVIVMEPEGNPHDHPFVRELGMVVENIDDAVDIINAMLATGV